MRSRIRKVEIVERRLIRAHVALVKQIHANNIAFLCLAAWIAFLHRHYHHVLATSAKQQQGQYVVYQVLHISTLRVSA